MLTIWVRQEIILFLSWSSQLSEKWHPKLDQKEYKCNCSIKAPCLFHVTPIKERQGFQKLCYFDCLKPLCKCPCTEWQLGIQFKRLKAISWGPHCPSEKTPFLHLMQNKRAPKQWVITKSRNSCTPIHEIYHGLKHHTIVAHCIVGCKSMFLWCREIKNKKDKVTASPWRSGKLIKQAGILCGIRWGRDNPWQVYLQESLWCLLPDLIYLRADIIG